MDGIDLRLLDKKIWQMIDVKIGHDSKYPASNRPASASEFRGYLTKYLTDKLAENFNISNIHLPWVKMKEESIINWPPDVQFKPFYLMKNNELRRLHELAKSDRLDFSPEFLRIIERQLKKGKIVRRKFQKMVSDIETYLCNKLEAGTNIRFRKVPWTIIRKGDIINWPEGMPFLRLSHQGPRRLKLLHKQLKSVFFSENFLQMITDTSFNRTSISRFIHWDRFFKKGPLKSQALKN
jgi:hypothetical protein